MSVIGAIICAAIKGLIITVGICPHASGQSPSAPDGVPRRSSETTVKSATKPDTWSEFDELPLLERTLILPKSNKVGFAVSSLNVVFRGVPHAELIKEEPFQTDREAVDAAKAWILGIFGELPGYTTLELVEIAQSTSGSGKPRDDMDRGHTITFREKYRGIVTRGGAVIYIAGRSQFSACVFIYTYRSVPKSAKQIVDKATAIQKWRVQFERAGADATTLSQFDKKARPRLIYEWSSLANRGTDASRVAPTWVLDDENRIMVDGQSGTPWTND